MKRRFQALSPEKREEPQAPRRHVARQEGLVIEKLRNPNCLGQSIAMSEAIDVIARSIDTESGLKNIYSVVLNGLQRALGTERASILFFDPDGIMRFKAWLGISEEYRRAVEGHTPWARGTLNPKPIIVSDVQEDPLLKAHRPAFANEDIRALACIPLLYRGGVLGLFVLYSRMPYDFEREIEFALTLGKLLAFGVFRSKTEEELRASEEIFRASFELAPIGKALASAYDGRFLRVNPKFSEITGYSPEELVARTFADITHPDDQEESNKAFQLLTRGYSSFNIEKRYIRKNGSPIWTSINLAPIRDESGKVVSIVVTAQDITERKASEAQKQKSLRRYQELVNTVDGIVWEVTPKFEFTFVSKKAESILGYPDEQWINEPNFWADHIHPDDREEAIAFCKRKCTDLEDHDFSYRMIASDGRIVWLRDLVHVVVEDHRLVGLRGIMVDITVHKEAEIRLQESEARKSGILESALDCIITIDHQGRILEFNLAAEREFGYRRDEVVGKEMSKVIIPSQLREAQRKELTHYLRTGESPILGKRMEMEAQRADGSLFPVEISITRIHLPGPPVFTGFIRNITERKKAREELREANARLEERVQERTTELSKANAFLSSLIENIPNMIFVKDAKDLRFVRFNKAGEDLVGYSREDLIGKNDYDFFPEYEANHFTSQDRAVLSSGSTLDIPEELLRTRHKGERILHTKKIPLIDQQGHPEYLVGISEDITDKKRAEETRIKLAQEQQARTEAERSIQLRDDFLSIAAHELRTPLTPIRMNLQLIKHHTEKLSSDLPKVEFLRKAVQGTEQEFERFLKLIEKLLDVSRISAGRLVLDRRELDLSLLVKSLVGRFDAEIRKADCELRLDIQDRVIGQWDPSRIEQALIHLLSNAIKYGAHKPIEITVSQRGDKAVLRIADHGIGISKEDQGKLFHRFERVAPVRHFGGFGLGLFITREIVEAHGGTIRLDSELGEGTVFTVELPVESSR